MNVAHGWHAHRDNLARWAMTNMVNRTDCCGAYSALNVRGTPGADGKPIPNNYTDKHELTFSRLQAHFSSWAEPEHVAGVQTISLDDTCKVASLDIDSHSSEDDQPTAERNLRFAMAVYTELDRLGLRPLLWDSNGKGGYHLDVIFSNPIPAAHAYRLGLWLVRDWRDFGFVTQPESFPKQPSRNGKFGNWLRLIGRHHTRNVWATVYDHEAGDWLEGEAAALAVLAHQTVSPAAIPPKAIVETSEEVRQRTRPTRQFDAPTGDLMKRAAGYLAKIPPAISKQSGHDQTFKAAIAMARFGLPKQDAFDLMSDWNLDCDPPWSDSELWHKIDDAYDANPDPIQDRPRDSGANLAGITGQKTPFDTFDTSSQEGNEEISQSEEWNDPEFLPCDLPDVMEFNYDLLPDVFRRRVYDIANRMNCPPDFSAVASIVAAAAVIGRRVTIRPKRYDDWTVVPNLWGCAVGRPGLMKTSAIQQAIVALRTLASEASQEHKRQSGEILASRELLAMKAKRIKKDVQAALEGGEIDEALLRRQLSDARDMEETNGPPLRRYIVMDSTYEACSDMLTESPNGFLQYRDELAGWWASLSRDGQENARSFWLECWNGDGDYYIDRIGRGRVYVPSNTVSVLGATQPGKLRSYLQGAIRGDATDDGMVQRHQMLVWPDASAEWKQVDAWPDNHAKRDVLDVFRRLDTLDAHQIGAIQDDGDEFSYLRFSHDAQPVFDEWLNKLEIDLRSDREPPHLESHFSKYRSLIPSLALIFHLIEGGGGPVHFDAIQRAILWHDYLASHARRAYGGSHSAVIDAAKKILKRIADGGLKDGFTIRDVYISHQAGLATKEEAQEAIDILVDFGWLRLCKVKTDGRPSITCQLHPKISVFLLRAGIKSIKSPPRPPSDPFDTSPTPANASGGRELSAAELEAAGRSFS